MGTSIWSLGGREPSFCTVLVWEKNGQEIQENSPSPTVAPQPHPCIAPCLPLATVMGSVSENDPDWEGEFKDLNRKEVIREL